MEMAARIHGRQHYGLVSAAIIGAAVLALAGCASKGFVREQVGATDTRLNEVSQRVDAQEGKLRETSGQVEQGRQRVDAIDARVGEVGTLAGQANDRAGEATGLARGAQKTADEALAAARDTDARLAGRIANRNRYTPVETQALRFDPGKSELKDESINALREVARALRQDPNAVVELRGYTDRVGSDQLNLRLSRDRVDSVVRYLAGKEGVELRRIYALGLGKTAPNGEATTAEGRAKSRRVEVTVLTTQG